MKVTVHGMLCAFDPEGKKDSKGNPIPTVDLYSDGEVVRIKNVKANDKMIGTYCDIPCDFKLVDIEGKTYKVFNACKES